MQYHQNFQQTGQTNNPYSGPEAAFYQSSAAQQSTNQPHMQEQPYVSAPQYQQQPMQQPYVPQYQQHPVQQPYTPQYQQYPIQQSYPSPYQPQSMMAPQPIPMTMQNINVNIQTGKRHSFLTRVIYFCFVGWWAGLIWLHIGFAFCALIVTLPLGLAMLNRLPKVITLRPSSTDTTNINVTNMLTSGNGINIQTVNVNIASGTQQHNFLLRALYFVCIGSWLGYIFALIGYTCVCSIVLLPIGLMMLNRLPAVLTLRKN